MPPSKRSPEDRYGAVEWLRKNQHLVDAYARRRKIDAKLAADPADLKRLVEEWREGGTDGAERADAEGSR